MEYDMILLRYGEITIKGRNRHRFEKAAYDHVKAVLAPFPNVRIIKEFGRMYVEVNGEPLDQMIKVLRHVFGIVSLSPVKRAPSSFDEVLQTAIEMVEEYDPKPGTTFKVTARRAWKKFPHTSQELNHLVASPILKRFPNLSVNVREPMFNLHVEVREESTYVFHEVIHTAGGFPLGSNGKAMLLLSGGIDSPVAGYQALRRGLEIEAVHFHSYPFTSERAKQKVIDLAQILSNYAGRIRVHMVPFTEVQTKLHQAGEEHLTITLMRRSMLRIASMLADKRKALAIVTGDSLGQVASQTLGSMNVIGRATELPLLRPLITMDKEEIVQIAHQIDTFETSILPYEDCCTLFVAKSPATNPNLRVVERIEERIPELDDLIQDAVDRTEMITLYAGQKSPHALIQDASASSAEIDELMDMPSSKEETDANSSAQKQEVGDWF
ncbi:tRNA uracil 4-sulfurtransferase ThiI [Paenibacillus sp. 1001270B_150601_E10]|uniref:tRNA uracil 4-sulfurtransferase ThiI n=1 Tax=Paenibacillus sp. 1001270B_150601_E10 TaxID=2787079 RepID=UPI0018A113AA|nr:tRNA uracil 4-sulfurtransferase ThiI [Paenibacillus sp. 1001270B_150601_E10]